MNEDELAEMIRREAITFYEWHKLKDSDMREHEMMCALNVLIASAEEYRDILVGRKNERNDAES